MRPNIGGPRYIGNGVYHNGHTKVTLTLMINQRLLDVNEHHFNTVLITLAFYAMRVSATYTGQRPVNMCTVSAAEK